MKCSASAAIKQRDIIANHNIHTLLLLTEYEVEHLQATSGRLQVVEIAKLKNYVR